MKTVVLMCGKMRTGKNALADFLKTEFTNHGLTVKQDAFANTLKDYCSEDFKDLQNKLNDYCAKVIGNIGVLYDLDKHPNIKAQYDLVCNIVNSIKTTKENWYEDKNIITRSILQTVGTNLMRNRVDNNFWVNRFVDKVYNSSEDVVICSDARFPNEIELVHCQLPQDRVITIKVERDTGIVDTHASETALDGYTCFDYVVENKGTLQDLKGSAEVIVDDIVTAIRSDIIENY